MRKEEGSNNVIRTVEISNMLWLTAEKVEFWELRPFDKVMRILYIPVRISMFLTCMPSSMLDYSKTRCLIAAVV